MKHLLQTHKAYCRLKNNMTNGIDAGRTNILICIIAVFFTVSCAEIKPRIEPPPASDIEKTFIRESESKKTFASPEMVKQFSGLEDENKEYLIGPGDVLDLQFWYHTEISDNKIVVGPDGLITVGRIGNVLAAGRTREDIASEITKKLSGLYDEPEVTLSVKEYKNNKAFVLGRVKFPGIVHFQGKGTLLEALSQAGGMPVISTEQTFLSKCSIIRGNDTIIWIDLAEMLHGGNMGLNARIHNNDVIFIPESQTALVYVMGEVNRPGALRMTGQLSLLDALMLAGGPNNNANRKDIYIIRETADGKGAVKEINLDAVLESADFSKNYLLKESDIIYVAEKGISKFRYVMEQILPFVKVLNLSVDTLEHFGVMPEFRDKVWGGQNGYFNND